MSTYKVKSGDGWYRIAKNTGVDVNQLLKLNNATLKTALHPNQEIKIKADTPKSQEIKTSQITTTRPATTGGTGGYVTSFSNEFTDKVAGKIKNFISSMGSMFGGQETAVQQLAQQKKQESEAAKQNLNRTGQAFYISYPEHKISTSGTGFGFMGDTVPLIKGHAASIIVDDRGNATYHTYGRYNGDMGSYKSWSLPSMQKGESQEAYLKRIRKHLEYNDSNEPVNATHIPSIDHKKARSYYKEQPEKGNYSFFDGTTCAGEACRGIDAGIGQDSSRWYDWLIPDTPENVREHNYSDYTTYSI